MATFEHAGITFEYGPHSVGFTSNGPSTAAGAIRRIRAAGHTSLRVLDLCCGVGVVGLTMLRELGPTIVAELALSDINIFNTEAVRRTMRRNGISHESVAVHLSDGLGYIPKDERFDLIVANPPHSPESVEHCDLTPSTLGSYDPDWGFHHQFFVDCHRHLAERGEVWLLENDRWEPERNLRPMIGWNRQLEYLGCEPEPTDPGFSWILARRRD